MAKKDKLIKSKSIYTIKKKHAVTTDSIIYENDYVTIVPNDGIYDDEMALFSDSNFKYRIDTQTNEKKRHVRGDYLKPNNEQEFWTLADISGTTESEESRIVNKPNYSSLKDFAYYGSAVELIKATINDIILRFPGGLYYGTETVNGKNLVLNDFEIDCWTDADGVSSASVKNPMRILSVSYMNYTTSDMTVDENEEVSIPKPTITFSGNTCPNSEIGTVKIGDEKLTIYMDGEGKKHLLSKKSDGSDGLIIRPKKKFIREFWNTLDDFERVLLNRDTTPVYKAVFETPYSNENGYFYQNKSYIWPTVNNDGFTPDISSGVFQGYLESLISLATFHDEYDSDNIWRMMTHESIKNLDWTFINEANGEEKDMSDFETKGIGAMIRIYGRQFDDIKRAADNIKASNSISYDEKNNVPDYFLSDAIENNGWEAQHVAPFNDDDSAKANIAFQRRLALSSNYIQSLKGTRRGIEAILGMFGYKNSEVDGDSGMGTYTITEYVAVAKKEVSYEDASQIRAMGGEYLNGDENTNFMKGYPVVPVKYIDNDGVERYYLIPWFDKNEKYDHPFYFQEKGGWGKMSSKNIKLSKDLTTATTISGNIYGETLPYMRFANSVNDMLSMEYTTLFDGTVCYVTDISRIDKEYSPNEDDGWTAEKASHYFILKNKALSSYCGFVGNDLYNCYGWKNITKDEIYNATEDGVKILYLESLIAEYKGNNPHVGYGQYDDGMSYLEKFEKLFADNFENGVYDHLKETDKDLYGKIPDFGFEIGESITDIKKPDNKKCAYYHYYEEENTPSPAIFGEGATNDEDEIKGPQGDAGSQGKQDPQSGDFSTFSWNSSIYKDFKFPDTPPSSTGPGPADETQANGVINLKNILIEFDINNNSEMKSYIQNVVLKYLEPMIPSTAIVEYGFKEPTKMATSRDRIIVKDGNIIEIPSVTHIMYKNNDE